MASMIRVTSGGLMRSASDGSLGAGANDLAQAGLGPAVEGEQQAHRRKFVVDDLQACQSGACAEARSGDEEVEWAVFGEHVADRTDAGAERNVGPRTEVVGHATHLLGEALGAIEYED